LAKVGYKAWAGIATDGSERPLRVGFLSFAGTRSGDKVAP